MNVKSVLFAIALSPSCLFAQKYNIKKGKITADNALIATYDGKGGIFAIFNLTISSPGNKPLINVKERDFDLENPMRRNTTRWAEITFFDNPEKKAGYVFPNNYRYLEKELLGLLFENNKPSLIQGEAFNEKAVNDYIKAHNFDFVADSIYIRQYEKENKERVLQPLSRDTKLPFELRYDHTDEEDTETTVVHEVYQDGILIGRVEKKSANAPGGSETHYIFWKRVLKPYTFEGETMDVAMLAYINRPSSGFDAELVLMSDKSKHKFKIPDFSKAEHQLVNWLISSGNW